MRANEYFRKSGKNHKLGDSGGEIGGVEPVRPILTSFYRSIYPLSSTFLNRFEPPLNL